MGMATEDAVRSSKLGSQKTQIEFYQKRDEQGNATGDIDFRLQVGNTRIEIPIEFPVKLYSETVDGTPVSQGIMELRYAGETPVDELPEEQQWMIDEFHERTLHGLSIQTTERAVLTSAQWLQIVDSRLPFDLHSKQD